LSTSRNRKRDEEGWPEEAIILAKAAHAFRLDALESLRRDRTLQTNGQALHDELVSVAARMLDYAPAYKMIPEAMEHLMRTGCQPSDPDAAHAVAVHSVKGLLVTLLWDWRKARLRRSCGR
jgi:hypothetical protein